MTFVSLKDMRFYFEGSAKGPIYAGAVELTRPPDGLTSRPPMLPRFPL